MDKKHSFYKSHFKFDLNVNFTLLNSTLNCPTWSDEDFERFEQFHFWLCCVGILSVSVIGSLLNVIGISLLSRRISSYNIFNELIIILLIIDTLYLSNIFFIKLVDLNNFNAFICDIIVPVFISPVSYLLLTLSIFMVLGIAHERSMAISAPITHRQSMMSGKYRRYTLLKYLSIILILAISFNIPKFLERKLRWRAPKVVSNINVTSAR